MEWFTKKKQIDNLLAIQGETHRKYVSMVEDNLSLVLQANEWQDKYNRLSASLTKPQHELITFIDTRLQKRAAPPFHDNMQLKLLNVPIEMLTNGTDKAKELLRNQLNEDAYSVLPRSIAFVHSKNDWIFVVALRAPERTHSDIELVMFMDLLDRTNESRSLMDEKDE